MCNCVQKCLFPPVAAVEVTCVCLVMNSPGTNEHHNKSEWPMHHWERKNQALHWQLLTLAEFILECFISLGVHVWCSWESCVSCWLPVWNITSDKLVQTVGVALAILRYWTSQSWSAHCDLGQTSGSQCHWTPATTGMSAPRCLLTDGFAGNNGLEHFCTRT